VQHDRLPVADATDDASSLPVVVPVMVVAIMLVMMAVVSVRRFVVRSLVV
jgi:hypothetical protein